MTSKERKEIKHSLKTEIDHADTWIKLAIIGDKLDAKEYDVSVDTRKTIVDSLIKAREGISDKVAKYLAEIDEAISKMS